MKKNSIKFEGDGNIVIQDANNKAITINTGDPDLFDKIKLLGNEHIIALQQIVKEQADQFSDLFKTMLAGVALQKNDELPKQLTKELPLLDKSHMIGRDNDLQDLYDKLHNNSQKQLLVVNGIGGVGKTTLAQVYATEYYDAYQHIIWITQLSENIANDFANETVLRQRLKISPNIVAPNDIFSAIMDKCHQIDAKPNLLIIDNATQNVEKIRYQLPKKPLWHILITSRQELNGFEMKHLDFLSHKDAFVLFKTHYTRNELGEDQINQLIEAVDYHTLTVEILAKTAMKQRYGFEALKNAVNSDAKANIEINRPGAGKIEKITSYLCDIFGLSQLSTNELWLLKQFACLPPEFQEYSLLEELINPKKSNKENIFSETLEELVQKGWLLKNTETDSYKMHLIIGEVVKKQTPIEIEETAFLIDTIEAKLYIDQSKDNPIDKFQWISYVYAVLATFHRPKDMETSKIMELQDKLGWVYEETGNYEKSKQLRKIALQTSIKLHGEEHKTTARQQSNLALVLQALGNYEGAKKLLEKVIISAEKTYGEEHPQTAIYYSNLAWVYIDLKEIEKAVALWEKAYRVWSKTLGENHPHTQIVVEALREYGAN